jgi:hypothetical protein
LNIDRCWPNKEVWEVTYIRKKAWVLVTVRRHFSGPCEGGWELGEADRTVLLYCCRKFLKGFKLGSDIIYIFILKYNLLKQVLICYSLGKQRVQCWQ